METSVKDLGGDFLCLQETKAHPDQVPLLSGPISASFPPYGPRPRKKAIAAPRFSPRIKKRICTGKWGIAKYDNEGRANIAFAKGFTLVNLYFPNGAASDDRHHFKMGFLDDLIPWLQRLEKEKGPIVLCGDYNIAHTEIDIHDPVSNKDSSGFKPEERAWMSKFLAAGFIDTFRLVHPGKKDQYSWWSFGSARGSAIRAGESIISAFPGASKRKSGAPKSTPRPSAPIIARFLWISRSRFSLSIPLP